MERYFDNPDIRRAAAIISGAKMEAKKSIPGNDTDSESRRYVLTSAIIEQITSDGNLNGKSSSNREIFAQAEAALSGN